jgi:hypothetical protein
MRWRLASQTTEGVIDEASGAGSQQGHGLAAARLCHKQSNSLRATIRGSGAVTMRLKVGSSIHGGVTDVPGVLPAETDRVRNAWSALEGPKRRRSIMSRRCGCLDYGGPSPQMPAFLRRAEAAAST